MDLKSFLLFSLVIQHAVLIDKKMILKKYKMLFTYQTFVNC